VDDRDDDPSLRHGRPDHEWQRVVVQALCVSPVLADRNARAMLVELVGDALGRPVHLREQATLPLQFLELVRFCVREDGGLPALAYAVATVAGDGRTSDTVGEQVRKVSARSAPVAPAEDLKDFLVTYVGDDHFWARRIAGMLEAAGHSVVIARWTRQPDPAAKAAWEKHRAQCARTVAVTRAAFDEKPGEPGSAVGRVTIQVDHEPLAAFLDGCVPGDVGLGGIPEEEARARLLEAVAPRRADGR
jgi:hypothetical protein